MENKKNSSGGLKKLISTILVILVVLLGGGYTAKEYVAPTSGDGSTGTEAGSEAGTDSSQDGAGAAQGDSDGRLDNGLIAAEGLTLSIAEAADHQQVDELPEYSGEDFIYLTDNKPGFSQTDANEISGQNFADLDELGRCGTAYAMLDRTMMARGERDDMSHIYPSGWKQAYYDGLVDSDPPALYNRSHLLAYALTGQSANERNLITGTRYMNAETMLYWEEMVMRYLDDSDNHVLYRISPYFIGDELVARGVEMEAYSVEDEGEGICYHVYVYNVQPGVYIDYATGESRVAE